MLKKAGHDRESSGAILSAGGMGAVISPPVLGPAAFLMAEILGISYLDIVVMAMMPTILYYLGILLTIEIDARRLGARDIALDAPGFWDLTLRYWYQYTSLFAIIIFLVAGFSTITAIFWSILVAILVSYIRRETSLSPSKLVPALATLGVPLPAAHMFVFYYAVLSEVSPPVALSPFAAAAITGGNPYKTMMLTWKYALPCFLVPFMFTQPDGLGILWRTGILDSAIASVSAVVGIIAIVAGVSGYLFRPTNVGERVLLVGGGLALLAPGIVADAVGVALFALALASQLLRRSRALAVATQ